MEFDSNTSQSSRLCSGCQITDIRLLTGTCFHWSAPSWQGQAWSLPAWRKLPWRCWSARAAAKALRFARTTCKSECDALETFTTAKVLHQCGSDSPPICQDYLQK